MADLTEQEARRLASEHRAQIRIEGDEHEVFAIHYETMAEMQEARRLASEYRAQIGTGGDEHVGFAIYYETMAKRLDAKAARNAPVTITITREQADVVIDALHTQAVSESEQGIAASKEYSSMPLGEFGERADNARTHHRKATRLNELESIIRKASE